MEKKEIQLAKLFHDTYERLAPEFGYTTREDTKEFNKNSPNGKLMVAVCKEVMTQELDRAREEGYEKGKDYQARLDRELYGMSFEQIKSGDFNLKTKEDEK